MLLLAQSFSARLAGSLQQAGAWLIRWCDGLTALKGRTSLLWACEEEGVVWRR